MDRLDETTPKLCACYHLSNVDGTMDPNFSVTLASLNYRLCGRAQATATITLCNAYSLGWHSEVMNTTFRLSLCWHMDQMELSTMQREILEKLTTDGSYYN